MVRILLVVYDNGSYISWFPQGLAYIAAVCKNAGHEVVIYNQDVYHYPDEHLTEYLRNNRMPLMPYLTGLSTSSEDTARLPNLNISLKRPVLIS
jgi:hypothetical protein